MNQVIEPPVKQTVRIFRWRVLITLPEWDFHPLELLTLLGRTPPIYHNR